MGEYAEMMLDGTCCSTCGEYLGTDNGYPTLCPSCADDEQALFPHGTHPKTKRDTPCPHCGRKLRGEQGLNDHVRTVHRGKAKETQ